MTLGVHVLDFIWPPLRASCDPGSGSVETLGGGPSRAATSLFPKRILSSRHLG
jgi:hypothetical protein